MKLWLLRPVEDLPDNRTENPWEPWYDKVFGVVIRAESEEQARQMADSEAKDENDLDDKYGLLVGKRHPWLDEKYSTCKELSIEGEAESIIRDVHWA